jgi:hypothetical protein
LTVPGVWVKNPDTASRAGAISKSILLKNSSY